MDSFYSAKYDAKTLQKLLLSTAAHQPDNWGNLTAGYQRLSHRNAQFYIFTDTSRRKMDAHRERLRERLRVKRKESPSKDAVTPPT